MRRAWWVLGIALAAASCQAFVNTDAGAGIGVPCGKDRDCQGASCIDDVCTLECGGAADCPEGTQCMGGLCQLPLKVAFIWVGNPTGEEWSRAHESARQALSGQLSYVSELRAFNAVADAAGATIAVNQAVAAGFNVVFANSTNLSAAIQAKANQYPDVRFFTCDGTDLAENHSSYYARMYKAWFLAGQAAAMKSPSKLRLGMVASFATPTVVQHINAFAIGARRIAPDIVVEVRWIGFWHDTDAAAPAPKEQTLTSESVATGCDVIAHQADNGLVVQTVEQLPATDVALSIGNNVADACPAGSTRCLGAVSWNWAPLYRSVLTDIHKGEAPNYARITRNIEVNPAESVVLFDAKDDAVDLELSDDLVGMAGEDGVGRVFSGPIEWADGSAAIPEGQTLSDDDLRNMCRFVVNVVQKADPADPLSMDQPGVVPAVDGCAPPM